MRKTLFFTFIFSLLFGDTRVVINNSSPNVELLSSDQKHIVLEFSGGDFVKSPITIQGKEFFHLNFQGEPTLLKKGNPQLPKMVRSIVIPDNGKMQLNILESEYTEYEIAVAPSKGSVPRNINLKSIPYIFSDVYKTNNFYPHSIAELGDPYIMRDIRRITVTA